LQDGLPNYDLHGVIPKNAPVRVLMWTGCISQSLYARSFYPPKRGLCSPAEREATQSQWLDYQNMIENREES
jgi:hypothetical protein